MCPILASALVSTNNGRGPSAWPSAKPDQRSTATPHVSGIDYGVLVGVQASADKRGGMTVFLSHRADVPRYSRWSEDDLPHLMKSERLIIPA